MNPSVGQRMNSVPEAATRLLSIGQALSAFAFLAALTACAGCGSPPQVVGSEECFQTVDALWTAVTSKRKDLLEQSATELDRLQAAGSLSDDGHKALMVIVQKARSGAWTDAATRLKSFMLGQRRPQPN